MNSLVKTLKPGAEKPVQKLFSLLQPSFPGQLSKKFKFMHDVVGRFCFIGQIKAALPVKIPGFFCYLSLETAGTANIN